jgi:aspartate carbamoyltransferase catalytic subunit
MRIDMVVIRHASSGAARFLAERIGSNVINAGDGMHEHPTQGLLDLLTLRDHFKTLAGRRVCICGDVLHSRVARSNIWGLQKLGAEVAVCGPRSLLPSAIDDMGVRVFDRIEAAIEWAEALNVLRLQLERKSVTATSSLRVVAPVFAHAVALDRAPRDVTHPPYRPMNPPSRCEHPTCATATSSVNPRPCDQRVAVACGLLPSRRRRPSCRSRQASDR